MIQLETLLNNLKKNQETKYRYLINKSITNAHSKYKFQINNKINNLGKQQSIIEEIYKQFKDDLDDQNTIKMRINLTILEIYIKTSKETAKKNKDFEITNLNVEKTMNLINNIS